jgi:hypothetical protein
MTCPATTRDGEAKLLAFVAGKIRGPEGARFRSHVDGCSRCEEFVSGQQALWSLLDEWEPELGPTEFDRTFAVRLNNLAPEPRWLQAGRYFTAWMSRPALSLAALTMLMALGLYLKSPFGSAVPDQFKAPVQQNVSPVEAEQMDRAFDDLQLLHQLDAPSEESHGSTRSM